MTYSRRVFILVLASLLTACSQQPDPAVVDSVKETLNKNLEFTRAEDIEKALTTLHSESPSYFQSKSMMTSLFRNYDLKYELLDFRFIARDQDLAYARVKQRTEKVEGPNFRDNIAEFLQIYKEDDGQWKLWSQAPISIEYLDQKTDTSKDEEGDDQSENDESG